LQTGKENIIPDSSRNYNIEIKKGMKIVQLQQNWRETYRHNFSYKKIGKMLKMIIVNHNTRNLN
jgi:hypothetical protein